MQASCAALNAHSQVGETLQTWPHVCGENADVMLLLNMMNAEGGPCTLHCQGYPVSSDPYQAPPPVSGASRGSVPSAPPHPKGKGFSDDGDSKV